MPRSEQRAEVMTLLSQMADKFNSLADDHERMASLLGQIPALRDAAPRWRTAAERYRVDKHALRSILEKMVGAHE
ncbi:MAG: hypothetical protein CMO30_06395 [Tistrella sp.]|uniref:hypothetical protein n=1 Tax=Tistrella sp. TaxID=2024861 RepID=UPI000C5B4D46|nr:hypothetical protein [Tistrella sp.]MAD39553.1 hypothetical protein [Tistrella sp.]MBA74898.1 hypothetical protein [Tistrella sp.]